MRSNQNGLRTKSGDIARIIGFLLVFWLVVVPLAVFGLVALLAGISGLFGMHELSSAWFFLLMTGMSALVVNVMILRAICRWL